MVFIKYTCTRCVLFMLLLIPGVVLVQRRKGKNSGKPCQPPEPVENAKLKRDYEERKEFNYKDKIEYDCKIGYNMEGSKRSRKCKRTGKWSNVKFECILTLCPELPTIQNAEIFQGTSDGIRNNYESVAEYTCKQGYYINKTRCFSRICRADGTWSGEEPVCEKRCHFKPHPDMCFSTYDNETCRSSDFEVHSRYTVNIRCKHGYTLYRSEGGSSVMVNGGNTSVMCKNGTFFKDFKCVPGKPCKPPEPVENATLKREYEEREEFNYKDEIEYDCKKGYFMEGRNRSRKCEKNGNWSDIEFQCTLSESCIVPEVLNAHLVSKDEETYEHSDKIIFKCDEGHHFYENDSENRKTRLEAICKLGKWSESIPSGCQPGCILPSDNMYKFMVDYNTEYKGEILRSGDTLLVMCREFSFYDYYNDIIKETEQNATCNGTVLSQIEIDCQDVVIPKTCKELQNGQVTEVLGQFNVSCNKGFSLNFFLEKSLFTCKDGVLKSVIGDLIPACIPDDCRIPYDIDDRLSVTYRGGLSLSGGSTVKNGYYVYFNCSKVEVQKYEPLNRRFKCISGQWIENERDKTWKFGNNGTFPICREAICEPACLNGGLCHKDNECNCKHMTGGERCEKFLCRNECTENGSECVAPGKCKCPTGRYGPTCEIKGCFLPELSAKPKISKMTYKPGETISDFRCEYGYILSPQKQMTCKEDGTWSNTVQCEKAIIYLIRIKTGTQIGAGTDANVYIYLHGDGGKTDKIYLVGAFESGDLDETRKFAKDVGPITGVTVGHDGKGLNSAWFLEFASIYVENMEEYYVFREQDHVWVDEREDKYLPRQGCIYTYDRGNLWYPKWEKGLYHFIGQNSRMSLRACKQMCTELSNFVCKSVMYWRNHKICWGFRVEASFSKKNKNSNSRVYLQNCK